MSKKYGFSVRLAAVAFVIAGVLGTAVAAPNFPSGDAVAAFALDNPFVGEIKWANPPKVDGATIGSYNVIPAATDADMIKGNMGNVGVLAIKTNGFHWDVVMRSKYGGRLYADGKDTTVSDKYPSGCDGMLVACKDTIVKKAGTALAYSSLPDGNKTAPNLQESIDAGASGAANLVVLDIAVGAAIKGVSGNFFAVGCTSSGGSVNCGTAPLAVRLGKAAVIESGTMIKGDRSEGAGTNAANGVSFANAIGSNTDAVAKITALTAAGTTEYLGLTGTVTDATIKGGFKGTNVEQYIYVNVGVHPSNSSYINANGTTTYKETFTFTLLNGY